MKTINKLIKELTLVNFLFKIKTVLRKFSSTVEDEFEKVDGRISIVEERVTVNEEDISNIKDKNLEQDNKIIAIEDNITDINEDISDLDSRVEVLEDKVAVVYTPKGSVANIDALFALTNQQIGWVYNLSDTGMNYVWLGGNEGDQGNGWDSLGGWVDFSEYYTRLEVDAKLDVIDLQKVTDLGNTTTNDIHIVNGSSGNQLSLITRSSEAVLKYVDTDILLDETNVKVNKELVGVDATQPKGLTTLQQVSDLIAQGGGDVEVGFGLSKNDDGSVRLGKEINLDGTILNNIEIGDDYFLIGNLDLENNNTDGIVVAPGIGVDIHSATSVNIQSGASMQISSVADMSISSEENLILTNKNNNGITIFSQTFGVNEYSLSGPDGDLIRYLIGDEYILFTKRIKSVDAIAYNELTTLSQVEGLIADIPTETPTLQEVLNKGNTATGAIEVEEGVFNKIILGQWEISVDADGSLITTAIP